MYPPVKSSEFGVHSSLHCLNLIISNLITIKLDCREVFERDVGRLDPKTGKITLKPSPTPGSRPYGITITPEGGVWYSESGVQPNTIVRFCPETRQFEKWDIPSVGGVVRNMASTPGGYIYIACSGVNKVGIVRAGQ